MACVDVQSTNADSEMEEGEIVDEVDYLSDISSEEEFLLRQRLKVLENYNNALERKEAKKTSNGSGKDHRKTDMLYGLSEVSSADADDCFLKTTFVITKEKKHIKPHYRQKRLKPNDKESGKSKDRKKYYRNKKKVDKSSDSDGSEFSDDDYKNKRRKLADAVSLNIVKNDTSTLKDRLTKMLCISKTENNNKEVPIVTPECKSEPRDSKSNEDQDNGTSEVVSNRAENLIDTCTEKVSTAVQNNDNSKDTVDSVVEIKDKIDVNNSNENSDEDLELLRQHALKTKAAKTKNDQKPDVVKPEKKTDTHSEDEDSDTAELRMICLKSRLLKKAIEIKQKQKLQKRLSNSSNMHDFDICKTGNDLQADNNTDIESVDMDIGSDGEDKGKELISDCTFKESTKISTNEEKNMTNNNFRREDELEEDEDLLRAKLLTSLSKNLPNLVDLNVLDSALSKQETKTEKKVTPCQPSIVEEKKFIIQLGDSDSEAEHEATKNLTKMHMKLSEQAEFQQKLDLFLKSTRLEVEKTKLPDVVQKPAQKPPEKFVAKAMNHLPKSEQIEYRNLVKRMAELEKIKQARQNMINMNNRDNLSKDTLKPRNFSIASNKLPSPSKVEEKIALSRKRIAEESAKMLKLKEEAKKLSQRYKIVATELKNIATAITFNKKQQKTVQNGLTKIRHQHQMLLKSVPTNHSNQNLTLSRIVEKAMPTVKLQKENEPLIEDYKNSSALKSVKISVVNNLSREVQQISPRLSVELDITNNKKIVKLPKSPQKDVVDFKKHSPKKNQNEECVNESVESFIVAKDSDSNQYSQKAESHSNKLKEDFDDYKSPLDSLECKKCIKKTRVYKQSKYRFRN